MQAEKSTAFVKDSPVVGCCVAYSGRQEYATGSSFEQAVQNALSVLGIKDVGKCVCLELENFPLDCKRIHLYPLGESDYYLNKNAVFASQILSSVKEGNLNPVVSITNHVYQCSVTIDAFEIVVRETS